MAAQKLDLDDKEVCSPKNTEGTENARATPNDSGEPSEDEMPENKMRWAFAAVSFPNAQRVAETPTPKMCAGVYIDARYSRKKYRCSCARRVVSRATRDTRRSRMSASSWSANTRTASRRQRFLWKFRPIGTMPTKTSTTAITFNNTVTFRKWKRSASVPTALSTCRRSWISASSTDELGVFATGHRRCVPFYLPRQGTGSVAVDRKSRLRRLPRVPIAGHRSHPSNGRGGGLAVPTVGGTLQPERSYSPLSQLSPTPPTTPTNATSTKRLRPSRRTPPPTTALTKQGREVLSSIGKLVTNCDRACHIRQVDKAFRYVAKVDPWSSVVPCISWVKCYVVASMLLWSRCSISSSGGE